MALSAPLLMHAESRTLFYQGFLPAPPQPDEYLPVRLAFISEWHLASLSHTHSKHSRVFNVCHYDKWRCVVRSQVRANMIARLKNNEVKMPFSYISYWPPLPEGTSLWPHNVSVDDLNHCAEGERQRNNFLISSECFDGALHLGTIVCSSNQTFAPSH